MTEFVRDLFKVDIVDRRIIRAHESISFGDTVQWKVLLDIALAYPDSVRGKHLAETYCGGGGAGSTVSAHLTVINHKLADLHLGIRNTGHGNYAIGEISASLAELRRENAQRRTALFQSWSEQEQATHRRLAAAAKAVVAAPKPKPPAGPTRAPYTRETLDRMRRGENAAQLGWTKFEYQRVALKHGIEPLLMPLAEAAE